MRKFKKTAKYNPNSSNLNKMPVIKIPSTTVLNNKIIVSVMNSSNTHDNKTDSKPIAHAHNDDKFEINNEKTIILKTEDRDNLSSNNKIKTYESRFTKDGADEYEATAAYNPTLEKISINALSDENDQSYFSKKIDLDIPFFSDYYNIPSEILKHITVKNYISLFNEKHSESITPSDIRVSPIRANIDDNQIAHQHKYKLECYNESQVLAENNFIDLMKELSKILPSWSLSIVNNPLRYIIYHMTVDIYGTPAADKCILLDKKFNASVTINMDLKPEYNKQYKTSVELIKLINELNDL